MTWFGDCALACALVIALGGTALGQAGAGQKNAPATATDKSDKPAGDKATADKTARDETAQDNDNGLVIWPAELPTTYPQGPYLVNFQARGNYVPVLHWRVERGALPPGI